MSCRDRCRARYFLRFYWLSLGERLIRDMERDTVPVVPESG